ncbi:ExbD/TolR family protein [Kordia sp.]|uniref:ExbD/TolR family protein n=1 Tax=Kordia sp. TaxID=1965332 RepID=UPI003D6A0465
MKNILKSLLCIIVLLSSITVFSQENTLETETNFMNCVYQGLPDKGAEFRERFKKAEQKLIELNYLKDKSGESYVELYNNLDNMFDKNLKDLGVAAYMGEISSVFNDLEVEKCMIKIFESPSFEDSKLSRMMILIRSLNQYDGDLKEDILKILDPKDFEHDYYKMITFTMIERMNYVDHSIVPESPKKKEENFTEEELRNAFIITIDKNEQLSVNGEKIALEELKDKVVIYLKQHTSKSVIAFQMSKMADYGNFIKIQEQIAEGFDAVRDQLAQKEYNRSFKELEKSEQKIIIETYPFRIKEL